MDRPNEDINKLIGLHKSLMALRYGEYNTGAPREIQLRKLLRFCANQLGVNRVSVWELSESGDRIVCESLYLLLQKTYQQGAVLMASDYPAYFKAMNDDRIINADDACVDLRTCEFSENYLKPLGIASMLDAPIFCGGRLSGVLCIEHVGDIRQWDLAEISYVAAVADCISTINEHDLWERARLKSEFLEQFDSLTGLFNRFVFQQRTEHDIREAPLQPHLMALVGLDNFTGVNDVFGTKQADQVLRNLGARFRNMPAGKDCLIARLGGDLFGFWLPNVSSPNQVESLLAEIQQALQEPVQTDEGNLIRVMGTLGVFSFPYEGEGIPDPVCGAEIAMLNAKKEAVGSIGYFSTRWYQQLHEKQQQIAELMHAFEADQLTAYYQPILNKRAGSSIGLEALVRWKHPEKGLMFPDQFLPLVTELGLMKRLGDYMLRQACSDARQLLDEGFMLEWVSVNLSADHLYSPTLIDDVSNLLREFNLSGKHLELEIVEELMGRDSELVLTQLQGLADLGISLSIDDFGTGYSSLSRLKHLPVTKLKIDKSFVEGLPHSKDDQSIVRSIVGLANALQLNLAAEGIETKEQADWLLNESVEYLQGYLYAKPMSFDALQGVLASSSLETIAAFTPATV